MSLFVENKKFEQDFPNVNLMIQEKGYPALVYMQEEGILKIFVLNGDFTHDGGGPDDDGKIAWKNYREQFNNFIKNKISANKDEQFIWKLLPLAKPIADYLADMYYTKFPKWPKKNATNEATLDVWFPSYESKAFGENIVFHISGTINVKDTHTDGKFIAYIKGSLTVKCLAFNGLKTKDLETKLKTKKDEVFEQIDKLSKSITLKAKPLAIKN